jgi:hypothetical protein
MRYLLATFFLAAAASTSAAQDTTRTIDPGMSKAQVVEHLGAPVSERSDGAYTFLYYRNGCEKRCGMHDVVVLENDGVVDAIFRSASRRYTGQSSSPAEVPPAAVRTHRSGTLTVGTPARRPAAQSEHPSPARAAGPRAPADSSHHP